MILTLTVFLTLLILAITLDALVALVCPVSILLRWTMRG